MTQFKKHLSKFSRFFVACFLSLIIALSPSIGLTTRSKAVVGTATVATVGTLAVLATALLACGIVVSSEGGYIDNLQSLWSSISDNLKESLLNKVRMVETVGGTCAIWAQNEWADFTDWVKETFSSSGTTQVAVPASSAGGIYKKGTPITCTDGKTLPAIPYDDCQKYAIVSKMDGSSYMLISFATACVYAVISNNLYVFADTIPFSRANGTVTGWSGFSSTNGYEDKTGIYGEKGHSLALDGYYWNLSRIVACNFDIYSDTARTTIARAADVINFPGKTGSISADTDSNYYPGSGALSAPTSIPSSGSISVPIPTTYNPTLGKDVIDVGNIGELAPADVATKTKVGDITATLDDTLVESKDVVIDDTTVGDLAPTGDNTETAKKFKFPALLASKFPFCIPFDFVNSIKMLSAPAVSPSWDIPIKVSRLGINESIHIDFDNMSVLCTICRWFLSAIWILALILITRRLINN